MKQNHYIFTALLALAGTAFLTPQAKALTFEFSNESYQTSDDLYLVVDDPLDGASKGYAVDLGSASQFTGLAAGTTLNLGNFSTDLASVFAGVSGGGTWQTSQAQFEVFGNIQDGSSGNLTEFVSAQTGSLSAYQAAGSDGWANPSVFKSEVNRIASGNLVNATVGTDGNSVSSTSGALTNAAQSGISTDSSSAPIGTSLDLIELPVSGGNLTGAAQDLGTFTLESNGELTFTAAAAPEPTTWAMMLGGLGFLGWMLRRKQVLA